MTGCSGICVIILCIYLYFIQLRSVVYIYIYISYIEGKTHDDILVVSPFKSSSIPIVSVQKTAV